LGERFTEINGFDERQGIERILTRVQRKSGFVLGELVPVEIFGVFFLNVAAVWQQDFA
jgi:hypothetical protein